MKLKDWNDICTNKIIYLFINKENNTWRTQLHEGTPTMALMDMCKQAKSDWHQSNLIQNSTTRQDPKS